ncbi:unnamed protein product [Mycena citricolor]|uniref:ATP-binding cassette transporter n=1 Tax=Mycena citricolor TaxID=2018698 RepID=A0AAD2K7U3_9AGAR|nr:unnamed protein product [Mycena citricolor]
MDFGLTPQAVLGFNAWASDVQSVGHLRLGSNDLKADPTLLVPGIATCFSVLLFVIQGLGSIPFVHRLLVRAGISSDEPVADAPGIGTGVILRFRIARLVGCFALLGLSIYAAVEGIEGALVAAVAYGYCTILSALSVNPRRSRSAVVGHVNLVILASLAVYVYRDIVPLATFTLVPRDADSPILWATITLLFATGVVIPLFTPRQYIPVDPLNPHTELNPEETASIISHAFFFFLDGIIFLAYRQGKLDEPQLYALRDSDASEYLTRKSFKYLDSYMGKARGHIFFGLMRVFGARFIVLGCLLLVRVLMALSGPYAMNHLLLFIEKGGQDEPVKPWVWILLIFLGPVVASVAMQTYVFINTRSLVQAEAILTQLVFTHSLRIRMKAEIETQQESAPTSTSETPRTVSRTESHEEDDENNVPPATSENAEGEDAQSSTVHGGSASVKSGKSAAPSKAPSKADSHSTAATAPAADKPKSGGSLVGKINNLVTTDLDNIVDSRDLLNLFLSIPLQITLGIWFLHSLLGWSVWVGVASILLMVPLPGYMAKMVQSVQKERLKRTDDRVTGVSEAVNSLRMVKLFGWEERMKERIDEKRVDELGWIRKRRFLDMASNIVNVLIPIVTMVATYSTYTLIMKQPLNASKVFSSMTVFDLLRDNIAQITGWLNNLMSGKVSLDRMNDFLKNTELLDSFGEKKVEARALINTGGSEEIGFRRATFSWQSESDGSLTRSSRHFSLKFDNEIIFKRGKINLVVGPTGSGKTSLLMALLGEMHYLPSSPDSWYNLPRSGGVAYAAQESWVLNETIRDNIVFNTPFDEERYRQVVHQCSLEQDLALFQAGDKTEVGEKGLTLSGGQKARLTLARAVYSDASILLLDDVLAALDVHTSQWIVEKCFAGPLIQNRTVILVTHNVALTRHIADYVCTFSSDGRISGQGTASEILTRGGALESQIRKEEKAIAKAEENVDGTEAETKPAAAAPVAGKLIVAEEVQMGHVSSASLLMYFKAMGGNHATVFWIVFTLGLVLNQIFTAVRTWWLGYWARQYDDRPASDVDVVLNLGIFVVIVLITVLTILVAFFALVFGQVRASRVIHKKLVDSVLRAPLRWLDVTPTSRIIARVTKDVRAIDDSLPNLFMPLASMVISMIVKFGVVVLYTPVFLFPGLAVAGAGAYLGQIYMAGQLSVKRLMSNARAPVLAHFGAAVSGLVSIRAFGAESKFKSETLIRIDRYTRAARSFYNLNRWISVRVDFLGSLFSATLAAYLVYGKHTNAGDTGFLINMAITFTQMLLWAVRIFNDFEVQGNSLERIQDYIDIEHEKSPTPAGVPPAYWPASGDLRVENLSARYSLTGPDVLHNISFTVKPGERIGIVGRTGSGKSSLTLSLLQCIPTDGKVYYDGIDTSTLNLDALRSSITIIPQVPELLSGTVRSNLDPFGQYDDLELNYALRAAGLFALQDELDEGRITLDSAVAVGGGNLSVGQRQIFALARAIVRKSKVLILDEATSAIDYKTDAIIQNSLRQELHNDVSLITVAHRLQTIMDADKIMVLDAGNIAEFDSPKELLKIPDGKLRALVEESGERDALYAMAGADI